MQKMTCRTVAAVGMVLAFSTSAGAVNQERIPELPRDGRDDGSGATITGCVGRGTATGTYVLTRTAKEDEAAARGAVRRPPIVLSSTDIDMGRHVGHSVTVTGSYAREWAPAFATTAATEKSAPVGVVDDSRKAPRTFTVKSLKVVADSCSQPAD